MINSLVAVFTVLAVLVVRALLKLPLSLFRAGRSRLRRQSAAA